MFLPQLRRVRWAVRATLVLGVAASVVANVLHALDNPISQAIAAWPPLALLLTVELISRVPVHRRWLAATRLLATATIAGIAAWVSYWHMAAVAARYGEATGSAHLLPFSVDGLIVIASVSLVELAGRIRAAAEQTAEPVPAPAPVVDEEPAPTPEPVADGMPSDTPPEPHPTAVKIAALRKRYPRITQQKAAQRLDIAVRTVARHWGDSAPVVPTPEPEPINGNIPQLEGVPS